MTQQALNYLLKAEGYEIHRNTKEDDITTAGGIYRAKHPTDPIFKYIDDIARSINLPAKSSTWTKQQIETLNTHIKNNNLTSTMLQYISNFYDKYLASAHIDKFPMLCQVTVLSLYTNSPKYGWISIQQAINHLIDNDIVKNISKLSTDGVAGPNTIKAVVSTTQQLTTETQELLYEAYILLAMSAQYGKLVASSPDKYLQYLVGWNNRLQVLAEVKTH